DAAGPGGDGKGEGVEGLFAETVDLLLGNGRCNGFGFFRAGGAVFLVEQGPADHGEDDAAGELHGGQSDAEEGENGGADEFDDGEEDDGVDGDSAGEGAVGFD